MALYEIRENDENDLVPFRSLHAEGESYEVDIEELLWKNPEAFFDFPIFPVARQPVVSGRLQPDVVALDEDGHVYVIEVKRNIARKQLAQCLEYAGWALETSFDELEEMFRDFHAEADFRAAWKEFTDGKPVPLTPKRPQLVLVARDFDSRTEAALRYLVECGCPIKVLRVTIYKDQEDRRFVVIDADHEPELPQTVGDAGLGGPRSFMIDGRRVVVSDLIDAGLIEPDTVLKWPRPIVDKTYNARVLSTGDIRLDDGRTFATPSRAAREAAGVVTAAGWNYWRAPDGRTLSELRSELLEQQRPETTDQQSS